MGGLSRVINIVGWVGLGWVRKIDPRPSLSVTFCVLCIVSRLCIIAYNQCRSYTSGIIY